MAKYYLPTHNTNIPVPNGQSGGRKPDDFSESTALFPDTERRCPDQKIIKNIQSYFHDFRMYILGPFVNFFMFMLLCSGCLLLFYVFMVTLGSLFIIFNDLFEKTLVYLFGKAAYDKTFPNCPFVDRTI